ncbi:hypothetical protein GQ457_01G027650 [Hibiscus cannabinus]
MLCYWDIVGNMKELGYDNDAWLYFRVPGVVFSTYALVLVVDDDAVRRIVGFLNTRGIVELYVVVGNARGIITEADENTVNEVVGNAVNDIDEDEHETVNEVGEKGTSQDSIGDEVADIEDLGEKETSQDSVDFLVNVEIAYDLDDEVERIRVNLRADRHEISTDVSEGEVNNDAECGSQPNVGNDLFEEDEDVAEVEGKLQDHENDYIESDEAGEYGESDDDSGDQICGAYMGIGKKQVGHKYDPQILNVLREKRGSYIEEYATLWGYAAELLHSNTGSTIFFQVHRDSDNKAIFHRMYIFFDALKKDWKEGCRLFIRVDDCFLKTATQGELLVAISRDGNNQMFHVAWAVVEGEGNESWKLFLTKLTQDLNHLDGEG